MLRAILALIKISLVIALVVWLAEHPGSVTIDWLEYKITVHIGLFFAGLLSIVVLGILIFSIIKFFADLPKNMARYQEIQNKDKGLKALALGLTAIAAGDSKNAEYQSSRAKKLLPEGSPLPLLLEAQSARLQGKELEASRLFMDLIEHKDTEFLGVRGLLQSSLDFEDYSGALELANRALELQPKQDWVLSVAYDLEVRHHNWDKARKILYRAEKLGFIAPKKAQSDRIAMYLAEAFDDKNKGDEAHYFRLLNKAYKLEKSFLPTVLALAEMYIERGKRKAAVAMIEKAWRVQAHPDLVALWYLTMPESKSDDSMADVRWFEKLLAFNPNSVEGLQALASVMIDKGLWAEARKYLEKAEKIRPNVYLYKLFARLEEQATHNQEAVRVWLRKAADAPKERVWICSETGRIYERWTPVSDQGLFNTIIWDFPQGRHLPPIAIGQTSGFAHKRLSAPV